MNEENTAQRLQETAAKCLSSLDAWNKDLKDTDAREGLLEAVHELRKVTSRLEIDIAMNDRKVVNAKPLPVPTHKSKMNKKDNKPLSEILPVAEIKAAGEKRKIKIEEEKQAKRDQQNQNNDNASQDTSAEAQEEKPKAPRKPRRKKMEDKGEE